MLVDFLKEAYKRGVVTTEQLQIYLNYGRITQAEYDSITQS